MDILLIQPPVRDFYQTVIRTQPIGLAYLAAALQQHKHKVEILDCQVPGHIQPIAFPRNFLYMKQFYASKDLSPYRLHSKFFHFGLSYREIYEHIKNRLPQVVGIACQFTPYINEAMEIASIIKSIAPNIPVIFGGAHASCRPKEVLSNPYVDYVVIGEGERTLPQLIHTIGSGHRPWEIDGIGFKVKGNTYINCRKNFIEDLDSLPFPARDILNSFYKLNGKPYTMLITSRGCPQGCLYCSVGYMMGSRYRMRSPENIIKEIRDCRDTHGISQFDIEDDNFTFDPHRACQILDYIFDEFNGDEIKLFAMNGLSLISLNKTILHKMKKTGFQHLDLALGSISASANKRMNRSVNLAKANQVLKQANTLGFPVTTYMILGLPEQSLEEMLDSILCLAKNKTFLGPSIFYPSPRTQIYEKLEKSNYFSFPDYSILRSSTFPVETNRFSRLDIITLLRLSRWINFIKQDLSACGISEISFSELSNTAVSQWWPRNVPKTQSVIPLFLSSSKPLRVTETGKILTALLLHWNNFCGIRRIYTSNKEICTYQIFPYKTSYRVMNLFENKQGSMLIRAAIKKPLK